jgi:hypothetical protein
LRDLIHRQDTIGVREYFDSKSIVFHMCAITILFCLDVAVDDKLMLYCFMGMLEDTNKIVKWNREDTHFKDKLCRTCRKLMQRGHFGYMQTLLIAFRYSLEEFFDAKIFKDKKFILPIQEIALTGDYQAFTWCMRKIGAKIAHVYDSSGQVDYRFLKYVTKDCKHKIIDSYNVQRGKETMLVHILNTPGVVLFSADKYKKKKMESLVAFLYVSQWQDAISSLEENFLRIWHHGSNSQDINMVMINLLQYDCENYSKIAKLLRTKKVDVFEIVKFTNLPDIVYPDILGIFCFDGDYYNMLKLIYYNNFCPTNKSTFKMPLLIAIEMSGTDNSCTIYTQIIRLLYAAGERIIGTNQHSFHTCPEFEDMGVTPCYNFNVRTVICPYRLYTNKKCWISHNSWTNQLHNPLPLFHFARMSILNAFKNTNQHVNMFDAIPRYLGSVLPNMFIDSLLFDMEKTLKTDS